AHPPPPPPRAPAPAQHHGNRSPAQCPSSRPPQPPPVANERARREQKARHPPPPSHPAALRPWSIASRARRRPAPLTLHILARPQPRSPLQSFKPSWVLQHDRHTAFLRLSHGFPSRQSNAKPVPYLCTGLDCEIHPASQAQRAAGTRGTDSR